MIFPEGIAQNGILAPSLPRFRDPQTAFTFHYYCTLTQMATSSSPADAACRPLEQHGIGSFLTYDSRLGVPGVLGEFSCNDANDDNAAVVDLVGHANVSWTAWMYYRAKSDPANCGGQGILRNDASHGSVGNAKPGKLAAFEIPFAQAIAGTPLAYSYDRATRVMSLRFRARAVPGATLRRDAATMVFAPKLVYPRGYRVLVRGGRVTSPPDAARLMVVANRPGAKISVTLRPR